jgi:hypothetical protein
MTDATVFVIENNLIVDSADGWGINIRQGNTIGLVYNFTIRNNDLSNNYNDNGMTIAGRNLTIENNVGNGKVHITGWNGTTISNNSFNELYINGVIHYVVYEITNNTVHNLEVSDFDFFILSNNTISGRTRIIDSNNGIVLDNIFLGRFQLGSGGSVIRDTIISQNVFNEVIWQIWGYPKVVNYFNKNWYFDYIGVDDNEDDIGDTPYIQDTGNLDPQPSTALEEVVDQQPLIRLRGFETPEPVTTTTSTTDITTTTTDITTTATDTTTTSTNGTTSGAQFPFVMFFSLVGGVCGIAAIIIVLVVIRRQN